MQTNPQPGTLLAGRYRLVRVIGEGGMGVVLEAENIATERRVAVKWLHPSIAKNPEASQRLIREATATSRIRHPNVVDVYDVVREGEAIILVMELLEGEPLERLLARGGVPIHQLLALLIPAMRGVAEAHRLGIIHRDVHPANIFLARQAHDPRPIVKVLDFGISKMGGDAQPGITRSGTTLGTPLYMSFEQLRSAREVDVRTDVYSFGVVLYEAITGRPPFDADSFPALAVKIATATPIPPSELRPDLPKALEAIVLRAMARDREQRTPDLATLMRELEPFSVEPGAPAALAASLGVHDSSAVLPDVSGVPARSERKIDSQGRVSSPLARSLSSTIQTSGLAAALSRRRAGVAAIGVCLALALLAAWWVRTGRQRETQASAQPPKASAAGVPALPLMGTQPRARAEVTAPRGKPAPDQSRAWSSQSAPAAGLPSGAEPPTQAPSRATDGRAETDPGTDPEVSKLPARAKLVRPASSEPNVRPSAEAAGKPLPSAPVPPTARRARSTIDGFRAGHAYPEDF